MADHTLLDPSWFAYDTPGLWNNYTHNGLLYLYTPDGEQKSRWIQMIRDKKPDQVEAGCSECCQAYRAPATLVPMRRAMAVFTPKREPAMESAPKVLKTVCQE